MSNHAAARITDTFGHDAELEGIAVGVAVGALMALGVIATGGLGAVAIGAAIAIGGTAAFAGAAIGKQMAGPATGQLTTGSRNVFVNGLPATMVELASGDCYNDTGSPRRVATGSSTVFVNGKPAGRVTEMLDCGAVILTGSANVFIGGPRQSPVCSALRGEETTFERFRIDAQAASAAYDPPETRKPPEGYRNATAEDLQNLRLDQSMLEHPIDKATGKPSEFRAAIFIHSKNGAPLVAYKGTSSGEDWKNNIKQGLGNHTFYYDQAQQVASRVAGSPAGKGAHLTGHSLGGGMAWAGSRASGLPATTFNAAGLNAKSVPHPVASDIDAVYVEGEPLHGLNSKPIAPDAAATKIWPLAPPSLRSAASDPRWKVRAAWRPFRSQLIGVNVALNDVLLHLMDNVDASLSQRRRKIERSLAKNGCS